ncbi:MAG: hypothetical protein RBR87_08075 [Bacteroidales bacterium]|jgi:hypothetical protein|nr:hypothetical protein [Bacteroidales bacterium]
MSAEKIGPIKGGKTKKSFAVFRNPSDNIVYVEYAGKTNIGKAASSVEAMRKAEAWLYDK